MDDPVNFLTDHSGQAAIAVDNMLSHTKPPVLRKQLKLRKGCPGFRDEGCIIQPRDAKGRCTRPGNLKNPIRAGVRRKILVNDTKGRLLGRKG